MEGSKDIDACSNVATWIQIGNVNGPVTKYAAVAAVMEEILF
jgi:hypothetical protein